MNATLFWGDPDLSASWRAASVVATLSSRSYLPVAAAAVKNFQISCIRWLHSALSQVGRGPASMPAGGEAGSTLRKGFYNAAHRTDNLIGRCFLNFSVSVNDEVRTTIDVDLVRYSLTRNVFFVAIIYNLGNFTRWLIVLKSPMEHKITRASKWATTECLWRRGKIKDGLPPFFS